jgi:uncharacterized protein (DUF952 family)
MSAARSRLFHVATAAAWQAHRDACGGTWTPPSLAAVGFIHLSFAAQLSGTLAIHFADRDAVVLLEIDPSSVAADLRIETVASRTGDGRSNQFPHLYRALTDTDFLRYWPLARDHGSLRPPDLGERPESDRPPGRTDD